MTRKIVKVKVKYGTSERLAKIFKVTTRSVSNALSGRSNTELACKIRKSAVEMGGDAIYESSNN